MTDATPDAAVLPPSGEGVIALVDIGAALVAAGLDATEAAKARVQALAWSEADRSLYVVVAQGRVFRSRDDGCTWSAVDEVNGGAPAERSIDSIVDTVRGSVLLIGREHHDGLEWGVVWRKARGEAGFTRVVAAETGWRTGKAGNAAAGYFGAPPVDVVALAVYGSPAHLWTSRDDGLTWRRHDLSAWFREHVHAVHLPRSVNASRTARLWVTGGDDPSGERSGVLVAEGFSDDGALAGVRWALRERPGYRLVGLAGDDKHVYVGNESSSGGVLRILDNAESIALGDFEYALGKGRHDYHQFRSMIATPDGLLASASDSYVFVGDNVRADSGGYFYLSQDGGASFAERSLGLKWTAAMAFDGRAFWVAGGMSPPDVPAEPSDRGLRLIRIPRPGAWEAIAGDYCAKALVVDSSPFYQMAGYAEHPRPALAPGECTFRADLSAFAQISVEIETHGPGVLAVDTLPFQNWTSGEDAWREVLRMQFDGPAHQLHALTAAQAHGRWYRVRNAGGSAVELERVVIAGRRLR